MLTRLTVIICNKYRSNHSVVRMKQMSCSMSIKKNVSVEITEETSLAQKAGCVGPQMTLTEEV